MKKKLLIALAAILTVPAALGLHSLDWDWIRYSHPVYGFSLICPREEVALFRPDGLGCANAPDGPWLGSVWMSATDVSSGEAYVQETNARFPDARILIIDRRKVGGLDAVVTIAPVDSGLYDFKYSDKAMYLVRSGKLYTVGAWFGDNASDEKFLASFRLGPNQP